MIIRPQALHVAASRRTTGVCTTSKEARRTVGLPGQSPTPRTVAPARAVPGGKHTYNGFPCFPGFICILSPTRKKRVSDAFTSSPMKGWSLYVRPSSGSAKKALKKVSAKTLVQRQALGSPSSAPFPSQAVQQLRVTSPTCIQSGPWTGTEGRPEGRMASICPAPALGAAPSKAWSPLPDKGQEHGPGGSPRPAQNCAESKDRQVHYLIKMKGR